MRNLVHRYQDRTALNGVSFDVRPAELFGLLGPNGSGKTTLFRILSTLMVPTSGSATIAGLDAVRQPGALRRHIGVVFQAQSVDPKLTAYENLWHQGHLYGLRGTELKVRINEILTRVGLLDRAGDLVETFSGGMQRRIELAKGLLHHPEVLLLDEPTTGLDPIGTREMKDLILSLKAQGKTVLLCSHLLADVQDVCDQITILFRGRMMELSRDADGRPMGIAPVRDVLQIRDITNIETTGLNDAQIAELREFLRRLGVNTPKVTHPTTTLEDLFMRVVKENTGGNGRIQAGA